MVDFIRVKQFVLYEFLNLKKWKKYRRKNKETGEIEEGLITFIGKLKITYSFLTGNMYVQGRIINLVEKSNYLNFDDFDNSEILIKKCFNKANSKLNRLFVSDFTVDISQMYVTQIEYSVNINTPYKSEYINLLNLIYIENKDKKYNRYLNYTIEYGLDLDSSFYLKTKSDFLKNRKTNFCLDIYDKEDQLKNKAAKNKKDCGKTKVLISDIKACKHVLRIECKAYYEYIKMLCEKFEISNTLENLFNFKIAEYAITSKIEYLFGSGNFYKQSKVELKTKDTNLKANVNIPFSELSEYFAKDRKKVLNKLNICPYGFIPEDWDIDTLKNPIKLILEKKSEK